MDYDISLRLESKELLTVSQTLKFIYALTNIGKSFFSAPSDFLEDALKVYCIVIIEMLTDKWLE